MQINKERLIALWKNRDAILNDCANNEIIKRFDWLDEKMEELIKTKTKIVDDNHV